MKKYFFLFIIFAFWILSFLTAEESNDLYGSYSGCKPGTKWEEINLSNQPASGKILFNHKGFEAFSQGQTGNSGANLYVTRSGSIRTINVWDYNQDGNTDILENNDHSHVDNSNLLIYMNQPGQGFTNLLPAFPDISPLMHTIRWIWDGPTTVKKLPTIGGGRCIVQDLNKDGWSDIAFCNFVHGWHGRHFEALIYWGSPDGYSETNCSSLPTLTASGIAAADLNGDDWPDLVIANSGYEYPLEETSDEDDQSYIYWGSTEGFSADRRLSLPTKKASDAAVADINVDGHPDIVFANNDVSEQSLYIYWGSDKGPSSDNKQRIETSRPGSLYINDLDGDGRTDILVGHPSSEPAEIFYNKFEGFVRKPLSIRWVSSADAADLNGDGYIDLVLAVEKSYQEGKDLTTTTIPGIPGQGAVMPGDSSSYFSASMICWGGPDGFNDQNRTKLPTLQPQAVKISDINGDGQPDLLFANRQDGKSFDVPSYIYWGSKEGYAPYYRTELQGFGAMDIDVVDANHDGSKDIILVNRLSGKTTENLLNSIIYWGNPKGFFSPGFTTKLPAAQPMGNASADLNNDGYPDIVFCNQISNAFVYWGSEKGYSSLNRTELPLHGYVCSIADFNKDGYLDMMFSGALPGTDANIIIFWGEKNGFSLKRSQQIALGKVITETNIGDMDGNGYLDLLIPIDRSLIILKGGPSGFSKDSSIMLSGIRAQKQTPQVADLNGDGRLDIFLCNYEYKREGILPSCIYWNSPSGLNSNNRTELMTMGCGYASIADLNNDGMLDIVTSHYSTGKRRSMPCYIYWGSPGGIYNESNRSELPGESVYGLFIADFDRNGFKDIVFFNHTRDFDHAYGSYIYWGSQSGFSEKSRSMLPTFGSHLSRVVNMGNILNRRYEENYISTPVKINSKGGYLSLTWKADCPQGSVIQFQVRCADSREELLKSEWTGPSGTDSYYTLSGEEIGIPLDGAEWIQYRAVFQSNDGSNYPVLYEVAGYKKELLAK